MQNSTSADKRKNTKPDNEENFYLKRAIGLNDSIRFCRELFGGDKSLMDSTITYLNDASSYMEALEYLAENFSWDEENETVKYFKDILSRKAYS